MKIGIEVITGFLGAGKSAFINSLIDKTIVENEKIVVMLCESGNTTVKERNCNNLKQEEYKVNSSKDIKKCNDIGYVKVIEFMDESEKMKDKLLDIISSYNPNRIIIEYNGTESLDYLYRSVFNKEIEKKCRIYTMYYICDGENVEFYIKNMGDILLPFIQNSDVIVINNYTKLKSREIENRESENIKTKNARQERDNIKSSKDNKSRYSKDNIESGDCLHNIIKDLEALNNRAHIILAKNNEDISKALEESNLLESKTVRNIRVKLQDALKNSKQVRK